MSEEDDQLIGMGVSASLAARYASNQRDFLPYLARLLRSAMSEAVEVTERGGLFRQREIVKLVVRLDESIYTLEAAQHGGVTASRTKEVRGIRLKTEQLPMEIWLEALGEHLAESASRNQRTSNALRELMGG